MRKVLIVLMVLMMGQIGISKKNKKEVILGEHEKYEYAKQNTKNEINKKHINSRYKMIDSKAGVFLIDTITGRTWKLKKFEGDNFGFIEIYKYKKNKIKKPEKEINENRTKRNISAIRSAISIYYSTEEGILPKRIDTPPFIGPNPRNYMKELPKEMITGSNKVVSKYNGKGGWYYDSKTGDIFLNLKGKDSKGKSYINY